MKVFLSTLFSVCSLFLFAQAPVNDDCAGLIDLGEVPYCSDPAQYTNVDATASNISLNDNIPACFVNGVDRDVWFQFTLPADGSIVDIEISVYGNVDGNGTMQMPQVAIYRGDCIYEGLAELDCASAPLNVNEIHLEQFGLTPGIPYYLRINDYSATASPNAGTFKLCIEKYVPEINMGDSPGSQSCTGTLWDSGGPDADYQVNEDLTFTICPQEFHQCIILNVVSYSTEFNFDYLSFIIGDDLSGTELTQVTGDGANFEVQIPGDCATIHFTSDFLVNDAGFQIVWECSPNACTTPPPTTCDAPVVVPSLPYSAEDLSNCFSGNTVDNTPCGNDGFLFGNDYIFTYTSPGDECIQVSTNGTNVGAGLAIFDQCPTQPGTNCITSAGGGFASSNPSISAAFLENPGTYYILFGSGANCSPFDIEIDTVTCPVVLPPASTCDNALNIGGCNTTLPEIIALTPGAGDPGFLVGGVNQGCFVAPQFNYSFFWFKASADGKFGFSVQAADPAEASDIDFNVWGPMNDPSEICDFTANNQPIRSSWAGGADPTGLADTHPVLGTPVLDDFDCGSPATPGAGGDDFVRRIDVLEGEIYVILLDDFGNVIEQGGISIDFGGTTVGVLDDNDNPIFVSADTAVCSGQSVQLIASGGAAYFWAPNPTLSCLNCPDPIATPSETTSYEVQVANICTSYNEVVTVKVYDIDLGPDVEVCNLAEFTLNPGNPFPEAQYTWTGPAGLSCYNCASPEVSGLTTGEYTYIAALTTPLCTQYDTIKITVVDGQAPQYNIADDQIICAGTSVNIGGPSLPGTFYNWVSDPTGFSSNDANPAVIPLVTTKYYLVAQNISCPFPSVDSVTLTVYQSPLLTVIDDLTICQGDSVALGTTVTETGITYVWTPSDGLNNAEIANPVATPEQTTTYTLTASNPGCTEVETVTVSVISINIDLNTPDTVAICQGASVPIGSTVFPLNSQVNWTPASSLQIGPNGQTAVATPFETTLYTATISVPGCTRTASLYITVDSLPDDLAILPDDTTVCQGTKVLLTSPIYEPAEYPGIEFVWTPGEGQLTPDSLYNMVAQPNLTTTYQRITRFGQCSDTSYALVTVIPPAELTATPVNPKICPGEQVQLNVTYDPGVTGISWMPATSLSCDSCDNPIASPQSTTTYSVTGEFMGCPGSASVTVEVVPLPLYQFPGDRQLCGGESVQLNLVSDNISTYTWTSTDPFFGTVTDPQPVVTPTLPSITYFLTATNGDCSVSDTLTITTTFSTLQAFGDTTICRNFTAPLSAAGALPGTYQWSDGQAGQAIVVTPQETTVYTVTYTFGDNCQLTDEVTVTVQGDGAALDFPQDRQLCPGESAILNSGFYPPGTVFQWSSTPFDPGFFPDEPYPEVSPDVTTTYAVTATIGNCVTTGQIQIQVQNATLTVSNDTTICEGNPLTLTATGSFPGGSYTWTPGGNGPQINIAPTEDATYHILYQYGDGCEIEDSVEVNTVPNFGLDIVADPSQDTLQLGVPLELTAGVTPGGNLSGYSFVWTENGNPVGNTQTIDITPSTNEPNVSYQVVVTSPVGCQNTAVLNIFLLFPEVKVPNAFSPDGDGTNDSFSIVVVNEGVATVDKMEIYNRWGQKVFESADPNARWDGTIDGQEAPVDVYIYNILWRRGDGALQPPLVGEVTLLR